MNFQIIFFTLGFMLLILGCALVFPFLIDYFDEHPNNAAFGVTAAIALFTGGGLVIGNRNFKRGLTLKQVFFLTTASWVLFSLFGAIPFCLSDVHASYTDGVFETVSGLTTTGSTVFSNLDNMSRGFNLWRAITHFIGGVGIIAFALILMPFLKIGGMQLFQLESSDKSEKIMPKAADIVGAIMTAYVLLNLACMLAYYALGMSLYDAVIHALGTIATGGFSSHDASFGYYESPALQMAGTIFMILSGLPFLLYVKFFYHGKFDFTKNREVQSYLAIMGVATLFMTVYLWQQGTYSLSSGFQYASFSVAAVMTTTGFGTADFSLWGPFASMVFFFLLYVGGCTGSTSSGIKMLHVNIAFRALARHFKTLIYPNGVFKVTYEGKPLGNEIINSVMVFMFMYVFFNVIITLALSMTGLDFITSITGAATAMGNVGPGLGTIIGPSGNFGSINDVAKWILCFAMLLGRLEIMTILVLFTPAFWRD